MTVPDNHGGWVNALREQASVVRGNHGVVATD